MKFQRCLISFLILLLILSGCTFAGDLGTGGSDNGTDTSGTLFDDTIMHTIEITIDPDIFLKVLAEHEAEDLLRDYRLATKFTFDGVSINNVGIRGRGNSSKDNLKRQFKISFDCIDPFNTDDAASSNIKASLPENDDREFHSVRSLNLRASKNDPTLIRELISYKLYRENGIMAPRASMAKVIVNGTNQGVYTVVEQLDKRFVKQWFDGAENDGNLYKGIYGCDFSDPNILTSYELKTNKTVNDTSDIKQFITSLNAAASPAALSAICDIDNLLGYIAVSHIIGHWDSYAGNINNDYIYHNPVDGKWRIAVWDCDNTFGSDWMDNTLPKEIHTPLSASGTVLFTKAMEHYQSQYDTVMTGIVNSWHPDKTATFITEVDRIKAQIAAEVNSDPHLISYDDWETSFDSWISSNSTPFDESENGQYKSNLGLKSYFQQRMDNIATALSIPISSLNVSLSIQGSLPMYESLYNYTSSSSVTVEMTGADLGSLTDVTYDVYEVVNNDPDDLLATHTPGSSPYSQTISLTTSDNLYTLYKIKAQYSDGTDSGNDVVTIYRYNPTPASPGVVGDTVTFRYYNGFNTGTEVIHLRGTMNSWAIGDQLTWVPAGPYFEIEIPSLSLSQYEYKFYDNGTDKWYPDPYNYKLDYAGNHNAILDK